jgi:hypothetical protein
VIRTLGIDLAAQDARTATCMVEWRPGQAIVDAPLLGRPLSTVADDMRRAHWTGIDAPFGWPDAFITAMSAVGAGKRWPDAPASQLRHRHTDRAVHDLVLANAGVSLWPLSVSSDRIATCAWRCMQLLTMYFDDTAHELDRIGIPHAGGADGSPTALPPGRLIARRGVVEVYPAGALAMWGLPYRGYKSRSLATAENARTAREAILDALCDHAAGWLIIPGEAVELLAASDDALDALICALVAYATAAAKTYPPDIEQRGAAQREGWIHLPLAGSLDGLALSTA